MTAQLHSLQSIGSDLKEVTELAHLVCHVAARASQTYNEASAGFARNLLQGADQPGPILKGLMAVALENYEYLQLPGRIANVVDEPHSAATALISEILAVRPDLRADIGANFTAGGDRLLEAFPLYRKMLVFKKLLTDGNIEATPDNVTWVIGVAAGSFVPADERLNNNTRMQAFVVLKKIIDQQPKILTPADVTQIEIVCDGVNAAWTLFAPGPPWFRQGCGAEAVLNSLQDRRPTERPLHRPTIPGTDSGLRQG